MFRDARLLYITEGGEIKSRYLSGHKQVFIILVKYFFIIWFVCVNIFAFYSFHNIKSKGVFIDKMKLNQMEMRNEIEGINNVFGIVGNYFDSHAHSESLPNDTLSANEVKMRVLNRIRALESIINKVGYPIGNIVDLFNYANPQGGVFYRAEDLLDKGNNIFYGGVDAIDFQDQITYLTVLEKIMRSMPFQLPMSSGNLRQTSGFGKRKDPFIRRNAFHSGIDFAAPLKSPVYSTSGGKVAHAGDGGAYGLMVKIDHGCGISTVYAHLAKIYVRKGQEIAKGASLGIMGNTGRSTNPHLHYEVRINNKHVDPGKFLYAGQSFFHS